MATQTQANGMRNNDVPRLITFVEPDRRKGESEVAVRTLRPLFVFHDMGLGGLAIDVRNLAVGLARRGHAVAVATVARAANDEWQRSASDVERFDLPLVAPRRVPARLGVAAGVGRIIRNHPWSVVHVFSCLPVWLHFAAIVAARRARIPVVWTPMMHPARTLQWRFSFSPLDLAMRAFDAVAPSTARVVDVVAAGTEEEANFFVTRGARRVEMLPPAVEDVAAVPRNEVQDFRRRLGVDEAPLLAVVVARNDRRKGIDFAIRSFRRVRERLPTARLIIAGAPMDKAQERDDGVRWLGRLTDDDLARAYAAADLVVIPSLYEGFSRVAIEAWKHETPVVATRGVGLGSLIFRTGAPLAEYGDTAGMAAAMLEVLGDRSRARRCGVIGKEFVRQHFDLPLVIARAESLYDELSLGGGACAQRPRGGGSPGPSRCRS